MSAFICTVEHVALLAYHIAKLHSRPAIEVAMTLWEENVASVRSRYSGLEEEGEVLPGLPAPGPGYGPADVLDEEARFLAEWVKYYQDAGPPDLSDEALLKQCHCYRYQICEQPGWESSEAGRLTETFQVALEEALVKKHGREWIVSLSEFSEWPCPKTYAEAPWGYDADVAGDPGPAILRSASAPIR